MKKLSIEELHIKANEIRIDIIKMLENAGSGHAGGALGLVEIYTSLYFNILNHDPKDYSWIDRDRLITSNGHTVPVRYATMAHAGYFPISKLKTLRKIGSILQGHPERTKLPAIETSSGPLGSGLGQASGIAYASRLDNKRFRVFCITSDGEHNEGNHWEAVMFAAKYKLHNLTQIVDRNNIQIDGTSDSVMPLESLTQKYLAFNWNVISIDGNNFSDILNSVEKARYESEKPTVIIAKTIPGKGVSFMENRYEWHGKVPNEEEAKKAINELNLIAKELQK